MLTRREAVRGFARFLAASPLLRADRKHSELGEPVTAPVNVFDFAKLAKAKLDPLAWDYMDEGAEDEVALRDNRAGFERLIIRPHVLRHDVSKIDVSTTLFGQRLEHPIFFCPTGGKNCIFPNGEVETAYGAASAKTLMITRGGISEVRLPNWWQFTTGAEFGAPAQMKTFAQKMRDQGCSGISVTVDIYQVSHRERSIHNGLVRSWCELKGVPRNGTELAYQPDDVLWTTGDYPRPLRMPTPTWDTLQRLRAAA
ncbi:MAG: alpha-hydroxy-acid oxidizing protein, partial [Acidobacteriaceae bacterium]|nr:alpha-hydroxy-acid oxidizing protein [Acidobacteriaceae bacterium]